MPHCFRVTLAILLLAVSIKLSHAFQRNGHAKMKSAVFLSPKFVLGPGSVVDKYYYNIDFPRGHIALKSFNGEVVDEAGNSVPLHETYLHHWVTARYYQRRGATNPDHNGHLELDKSDHILVRNSGVCQNNSNGQYYGLGSETRGTATFVPDPYGIEVGNPADIPAGYEEGWLLNVHAIDTRGVEDKLGCTECRLREGFESAERRSLYLRYTVKWLDWDEFIVPVKIYIFDVTDTWKRLENSTGQIAEHECHVEYEVKSCRASGMANNGCTDTKRVSLTMPTGGSVIYGVAHQHAGGTGSTLYGEGGRVICSSIPTYGEGKEAGNEAGYIVGMSSCYPRPGSVKINDGETLILESNYSSTQGHTGVMGLFYILVADELPKPSIHIPLSKSVNQVWERQ
ncbi:hypothetical protein CIPAW_01G033000 [Carya illinoinensis]|nr:hypothetical protein CIPAW_01G033000 [Carya illinoinensis]KAG6666474.1 hypothetical protein CIPAW_01G033000 [Carya illinoinensis]KAG6666476.1 hypothetical protein CIPAW_01G033000 [Carya illinoinensis]